MIFNKSLITTLVILQLVLLNSGSAKKPQEWNDSNFDSNLEKYGKAFVKFYAPWCGHCKRLAPIWEEVADTLDESYSVIVKVDCTDAGKQTCQRFDVGGYPTLKFIKHTPSGDVAKSAIDYRGGRDKDSLLSFAKKYGSPLYKELKDNEISSFINHESETTFLLFTASKDTEAFKKFTEICEKFLGVAQFAVSYTKDAKKFIEYAGQETLVFQRSKQLTTNVEKPNGSISELDQFEQFVRTNLHGKVALRTSENDETVQRPLATVFIASSFSTNASYFKMIRNRLFAIAEAFPQLQFAVASMEHFRGYVDSVGFDPSKDNIVFTIDNAEYKRYVPKSSVHFDDLKTLPDLLKQFVTSYVAGELEIYYKSEPIPESQDPSKPFTIVAKSFDDVVFDDNKDVFIKMYAPWCGHCKKLAPIWDQLAEKLKDEPNVVIAKFDATANDIAHTEYEITGFPTLFFAKSGEKKKPLQYNGARTLEALVAYVREHSTKISDSGRDEL